MTVPLGCFQETWLLVGGSLPAPPAKGEKGRNLATHNVSGKRNAMWKLVCLGQIFSAIHELCDLGKATYPL